jgi:DNA segregation ATPase FtsK/SpoIIIE, S-DNA-T family
LVQNGSLKESPVSDRSRVAIREGLVIVFWILGLLTLLSLISFNPLDPGFFSKSYGNFSKIPVNWVGSLGSYYADLLVGAFGFAALLFPFIFIYTGWKVLYDKSLYPLLLWFSLLLSMSVLFSILIGEVNPFLWGQSASVHSGGLTGIVVGSLLSTWMGAIGALCVALLWFLLSLAFLFGFSPLSPFRAAVSPFRKFAENRRLKKERNRKEKEKQGNIEEVRKKWLLKAEDDKKTAPPIKTKDKPFSRSDDDDLDAPPLPLEAEEESDYKFPPTDLLDPPLSKVQYDDKQLMAQARQIEEKLSEFDIPGEVLEIHPGPVVTIYEFKPAAGVKFSRVVQASEDLAIRIKKEHVRIDRMTGKATIAVEIANEDRELIAFRELVESEPFKRNTSKLPLAMGKLADGTPYVSSLTEMPHLLVAGTTGSGKSVGINALINSILFRSRPDEVKFIMIDPKQVELKIYEGLPHLLVPVVTDVKKAANALSWVLKEMQERYKLFASVQVRSIDQYNRFVKTLTPHGHDEEIPLTKPIPYIVIVIDELYDLMAVVAKEVETAIGRLSAMARAVGIHLIIATQRPSRDVITGVIKSNLPARIAFQVREKLESRLILDQNGAETLEGKGDMLFLPPGSSRVIRIHGGFMSTIETQRVIQYIAKQAPQDFDSVILKEKAAIIDDSAEQSGSYEDPLFKDAVKLVVSTKIATASNLQRKMRLGYARAARLLDNMEEKGIVGPPNGAKSREVLISEEEIDKWME